MAGIVDVQRSWNLAPTNLVQTTRAATGPFTALSRPGTSLDLLSRVDKPRIITSCDSRQERCSKVLHLQPIRSFRPPGVVTRVRGTVLASFITYLLHPARGDDGSTQKVLLGTRSDALPWTGMVGIRITHIVPSGAWFHDCPDSDECAGAILLVSSAIIPFRQMTMKLLAVGTARKFGQSCPTDVESCHWPCRLSLVCIWLRYHERFVIHPEAC